MVYLVHGWVGPPKFRSARRSPTPYRSQEESIMAITRWTPFQEMYTLQNRLNSLLQDFNRSDDEALASSSFVPPVDIYEVSNHVVLKLEVPGMKLNEFNIQMENQTLTVRGERKFEKETKEENYLRVERRYGSFARVFSLPN